MSNSLKASDLAYLGASDDGLERVHYWKVPYGTKDVYAYVVVRDGHESIGWGGRTPPKGLAN